MFNFFNKKDKAQDDFKLMFDLEVLDRAFDKAISEYEEIGITSAKLCGSSDEDARYLVDLDVVRIKTFTIKVKQLLLKTEELK